jgi:hypothetical protein
LTAHPHLADLAGDQIADHVSGSIGDLLNCAAQECISRERAAVCCQALVSVTVNDALVENRCAQRSTSGNRVKSRDLQFIDTISLILDGALRRSRDEEATNTQRASKALGAIVRSGRTGPPK